MRCNREGTSMIRVGLFGMTALLGLACASTTNHGLMTREMADAGDLIETAHSYEELGPTRGRSCRFFLLNLIPWGNSTTGAAMDKALASSGGNAVINASVTTSLYGFVPIYNVLSYTCTTVRGVAIEIN
jgi:hypothetical protein